MTSRKTMFTISQTRRKNPQKNRLELQKATLDSFITSFIDENIIYMIQPMIHRIRLSGVTEIDEDKYEYDYEYFKEKLGSIGINNDFDPEKRMPNYKQQLILTSALVTINIYIYPINNRPAYCMEVTPDGDITIVEYMEILAALNEILPDMKVSSVEYALDLVCKKPSEVENVFMLIRRFLYIRNHKKSRLIGEQMVNWGNESRMNSVFHLVRTKVYERGPDNKKTKDYWHFRDLDRVRLEHTAKRKELRRHGIDRLTDLINDCRFFKINNGIYRFMSFEKTKKLPKYWHWDSKIEQDENGKEVYVDLDGYSTKDKNGNTGAFQLENAKRIKDVSNIAYNREPLKMFNWLIESLESKMLSYDKDWRVAATITQ